MATKSMVKCVGWQEDSVDERESRSKGDLPSSNTSTVTSWIFRTVRDTPTHLAEK